MYSSNVPLPKPPLCQVAAASGDARRALDICRHAIDVAELEGTPTVTSSHIQRAITNMYQSVKTKAIM